MTDEPYIHLTPAHPREGIPEKQFEHCPKCGKPCEQGFGLAGGGFGVYSSCPEHGVVGKIEVEF